MTSAVISPLRRPDLDLGVLLAESEQAGLRLVRRLIEEWVSGANRFDRPGEMLVGAWLDGRVVGVCGLNVDRMPRRRMWAACGTSMSCQRSGGAGSAGL